MLKCPRCYAVSRIGQSSDKCHRWQLCVADTTMDMPSGVVMSVCGYPRHQHGHAIWQQSSYHFPLTVFVNIACVCDLVFYYISEMAILGGIVSVCTYRISVCHHTVHTHMSICIECNQLSLHPPPKRRHIRTDCFAARRLLSCHDLSLW